MNGKLLSILCLVALGAATEAYVIKVMVKSLEDRTHLALFDIDASTETCDKIVEKYLKQNFLDTDLSKYPELRLTNGLGKEYKLDANIESSGIKHNDLLYVQLHGGVIKGALKHIRLAVTK